MLPIHIFGLSRTKQLLAICHAPDFKYLAQLHIFYIKLLYYIFVDDRSEHKILEVSKSNKTRAFTKGDSVFR